MKQCRIQTCFFCAVCCQCVCVRFAATRSLELSITPTSITKTVHGANLFCTCPFDECLPCLPEHPVSTCIHLQMHTCYIIITPAILATYFERSCVPFGQNERDVAFRRQMRMFTDAHYGHAREMCVWARIAA